MGFVYFLGRFHVLALHLPLGILSLAVALEALARFPRFRFLQPALAPTWIAGAVTAVLTVVLGLMHATESGFQDSDAVEAHKTAGLLLALAACLIALLRTRLSPAPALKGAAGAAYARVQPLWATGGLVDRTYGRLWAVGAVVAMALMVITGHLGGNLTHGDTYLVQYAPTPVRRLAGISAERDPRPKPKDLASADLYLDVVAPAIHQRCDGCHNGSKSSGGLSVADHAALMKGGEKGAVIVAGDPARSDLLRRISLPSSHQDYMPKDGKTPLSADEVAAVAAWIKAGAPQQGAVGALKIAAAAQGPIARAVGLAGDDQAGDLADGPALPIVPAPDPAIVAAMETNGFVVRPIAPKSGLVDVDFTARRPITDEDLARLSRLKVQVRKLNLRQAQVADGQLKAIVGFDNLVVLRLDDNPVTDTGIAALTGLKSLESLNLVGTKVSDAGMVSAAALPRLQRLYVWRTGATKAGTEKLAAAHPKLVVDVGLSASDVPPPGPVVPALN